MSDSEQLEVTMRAQVLRCVGESNDPGQGIMTFSGEWKSIPFIELRKGDIFRLEAMHPGEPISDAPSVCLSNPEPCTNENGTRTLKVESVDATLWG
jgi:hypothetical protein